MADSDWTTLTNGLSDAQVRRGVTEAIDVPNGGGTFVYGMRSVQAVTGAVGLYTTISNFDPMAAGGRIAMAIQKNGTSGINPMLFVCLQGNTVGDVGYLLGFASDENPAHLILMKGAPSAGIQSTSSFILRRSVGTYASATFYHFQLDVIVQPSGDVRIKVFENDLANPVGSPSFVAVPGMADYIDDVLGHTSGSAPYLDGRAGFASYYAGESGRAAFFDHTPIGRQL